MGAVTIDISEGQIKNAIAVAIAESFSAEHRERLVADVVRAHLNVKEHDYDKETLFSKRVGSMLRSVAEECIKERLEELRPQVRLVLKKWMGKEWEDSLLDKLKASLKSTVVRNLSVVVDWEQSDEE